MKSATNILVGPTVSVVEHSFHVTFHHLASVNCSFVTLSFNT